MIENVEMNAVNSRIQITDPAFDYDRFGHQYSRHRRTDPRIAAQVCSALGNARTVLNVGAGGGSYEPDDRYVVAVEPSVSMRAQRLAAGKVPAINATGQSLPFDDNAFDAVMAMVTIHHWPDIPAGLRELRRVARDRVVIMTFDPAALPLFWNIEYFPELIAVEAARYPTMQQITDGLGGSCSIIPVAVPLDCTDGFQEKEVRAAQSAWGFLPEGLEEVLVSRLAEDLASGGWDKKWGHCRTQPTFTGALRLVVAAR
jgi:SAM-dependent methyltransferase